ncbi:AI-2E family transporter [Echinicola rosea]|uniref:AI-2E family transporter n=1 Tax=Echinicola rosea TaxID=1807691 RepID=A0ABQ1UME0_9BACT|nr:AI-2E family transporter [Echinicola rosea]GGF22611.1 AI-2E family transporter [Echinicola rosea]
MEKQYPSSIILAAKLIVLFLTVAIAYFLKSVLVPLMFALVIAIMLFPLCNFLERIKLPRAAASIISVIVATLVLSGLLYFIVHQVIVIGKDGQDIANNFGDIYDKIQSWLESTFGLQPGELIQRIRKEGQESLSGVGKYLTSVFSSAGGTLANGVLVPLYTFFFLYYRDFFKDFLIQAIKGASASKVMNTINKIYHVIQSYLLGLVMVMGIIAVLNTVGLLVMGLEYAWFFGTLAAILILIPYIGVAIGSLVPALFALATMDSPWYALGVIGWFQVVQFLEGNFITPNIVGGKVSLNPLVAIISLLLGGMLFGLGGLILAIPMVAVMKIIFEMTDATKPFSFLIGEPANDHLKRGSYGKLLDKHHLNEEEDDSSSI